MRYSKRPGRAIGDAHRGAIVSPITPKPLPGQLVLDLKPAINPDWPEPSAKLFDVDKNPTECPDT